jgi:hypothetical protein
MWEGVVAEGAVTLLSAPEKAGKTTLLSLLLDRRRAGGELSASAAVSGARGPEVALAVHVRNDNRDGQPPWFGCEPCAGPATMRSRSSR